MKKQGLHSRLVAAHSSYDAEMKAIHAAISYIANSLAGRVLIFIDNQAAIKSILKVNSHLLFELSRENSHSLQLWLDNNPSNNIEF